MEEKKRENDVDSGNGKGTKYLSDHYSLCKFVCVYKYYNLNVARYGLLQYSFLVLSNFNKLFF